MTTYDPAYDARPLYEPNVMDSDYAETLEEMAPSITTKIQQQQQPGETWMDSLARLLPIIAATEQQRELLSVQVDRAKQGLPPLDMSQYAAGVQVGISSDVKKLAIWGGVGLLAVLALTGSRRG